MHLVKFILFTLVPSVVEVVVDIRRYVRVQIPRTVTGRKETKKKKRADNYILGMCIGTERVSTGKKEAKYINGKGM